MSSTQQFDPIDLIDLATANIHQIVAQSSKLSADQREGLDCDIVHNLELALEQLEVAGRKVLSDTQPKLN